MKNFVIRTSLPLLFIPALAIASGSTWHTAKISRIYPLANGSIVLTLDKDSDECKYASSPKYYNLSVGNNGVTEAGIKNIYSAALAGASSGKDVSINFDSDSQDCYINRLYINY